MSPMAQRIRFEGDIQDRDIKARASYDPVSMGVDLAFYELNLEKLGEHSVDLNQ